MKILSSIRLYLSVRLNIIRDTIWLLRKLLKYNASLNTDSCEAKMRYTIMRENHVIEKGMSIRNTRAGFGAQKVSALVERIQKYIVLYGYTHKDFVSYVLSTIKEYITYTHKVGDANIGDIEKIYDELAKGLDINITVLAGVTMVKASEIKNEAKGDFESLLMSRHSIRYFAEEIPSEKELNQALMLAARTPSACNRQGWHTRIFRGEDAHNLLKWQGGARGFENDIHCSILVTADLNAFLSYEIFQAYIDGGFYATNLINALHYVGLGNIPLSCGFQTKKLDGLSNFNVPDNEIPIVIIGCGYLLDEFKVAISTRQPIELTNSFEVITK